MPISLNEAIAKRDAARIRYGKAVAEFRTAYTQLGALDQLLRDRGVDGQGFGQIIDIVLLRHSAVTADLSGSLQTDIAEIISNTQIEG